DKPGASGGPGGPARPHAERTGGTVPRTLANAPIMILNGPNLNLLGQRQPEIYGADTLADVETRCAEAAAAHGGTVDLRQSNHEGALVDWIHEARLNHCGIVINPGAYSHTSVAILDALNACDGLPVVEVHISNIHRREAFRHHSYVSLRADGVIAGCGVRGYVFAVERIAALAGPARAHTWPARRTGPCPAGPGLGHAVPAGAARRAPPGPPAEGGDEDRRPDRRGAEAPSGVSPVDCAGAHTGRAHRARKRAKPSHGVCSPAPRAPLRQVRALRAQGGVVAVAGVDPGLVRQYVEDLGLDVVDQAG